MFVPVDGSAYLTGLTVLQSFKLLIFKSTLESQISTRIYGNLSNKHS